MNRVGMRCSAVWWLSAMVAVGLLASGAQAAGTKQKGKVGAPPVVAPDTSISLVPQELRALPIERIRTDSYLSPPVFPPLDRQTRYEAHRLRRMNTPKEGALVVAPYPALELPDLSDGELHFRGTPSPDTVYQFDGREVIPALTRPDTSDRDFPRGVKRSGPPPITPAEAVQAGISGSVVVRVYIDGEGKVTDAVVLSSPSPLLDAPALQSVRMSRFTPVIWDQKPVPCAGRVAVWFKPLPRTP